MIKEHRARISRNQDADLQTGFFVLCVEGATERML